MAGRARTKWLWLLAPVMLAVLIYSFWTSILVGIGSFLVVRDRLEPADAIFLLNGDLMARPAYAAQLLEKRFASRIVLARTPPIPTEHGRSMSDFAVDTLESLGVQESQIVDLHTMPEVRHTADEADVLLAYCRQEHLRKVIVVTSELHSRRARFIIRKVLRAVPVKVMLAPAPLGDYRAGNWFTTEDGVVGCEEEYVKLLYYHLKY